MKIHFLFLLLTLSALQSHAADKHICSKQEWNIVEKAENDIWNPGWILQAKKSGQSHDLHFHSRSLLKLWESAHFLILKDKGIARTSTSILVVHIPADSAPRIVYQSPEPTLSKEYDIELLEASEKNDELELKIRIFDKRSSRNQLSLRNKISTD